MAYKPCHIITNDCYLSFKLLGQGIDYELGSEDYTEEEGVHYHFLVHWPRNQHSGELTPTRNVAIRKWRRENPRAEHCPGCYDRAFGPACQYCGLFYKIIWCHTPEHHNNVKIYIEEKWVEHPEWKINSIHDIPEGAEEYPTDEEPEPDAGGVLW